MSAPEPFGRALTVLVLCLALTGCNLTDQLGLTQPPQTGTLEIALSAPKGASASLSIKGDGLEASFTDDGRGFTTKKTVTVGAYTVQASSLGGYAATVSVTTSSGNANAINSAQVRVEADATSSVSVTYKAVAP